MDLNVCRGRQMGIMMGKKLVLGILAHVDAGKTTLAESILYMSGSIRKAGRGSQRYFSGYGCAGAVARHYDLQQTGRVFLGGNGGNAVRYARSR